MRNKYKIIVLILVLITLMPAWKYVNNKSEVFITGKITGICLGKDTATIAIEEDNRTKIFDCWLTWRLVKGVMNNSLKTGNDYELHFIKSNGRYILVSYTIVSKQVEGDENAW